MWMCAVCVMVCRGIVAAHRLMVVCVVFQAWWRASCDCIVFFSSSFIKREKLDEVNWGTFGIRGGLCGQLATMWCE